MANMQDVSSQLMKSPKELASWNFPLSQILDEYFNLLPEACKIHYGEAALVIQNSVNAYVRRVEELYDETRCLSHKIVNHNHLINICHHEADFGIKVESYNFFATNYGKNPCDGIDAVAKRFVRRASLQNSADHQILNPQQMYEYLNENLHSIRSLQSEEKCSQREHKTKRNLIDFSQFQLLDFDKEIGRNINLKNHDGKSVKFLHYCFSQLENPHAGLHIEVFDIEGEVIGKKYDFRCNQKLTKTGTLVEEFTPKDFQSVEIYKSSSNASTAILRKCIRNDQSLGYFLNGSTIYNRKINNCNSAYVRQDVLLSISDEIAEKSKSSVQDSDRFTLNQIESLDTENCTLPIELEETFTVPHQDDNDDNDNEGDTSYNENCNNCHNTYDIRVSGNMEIQLEDDRWKTYLSKTDVQCQESKIKINSSNTLLQNNKFQVQTEAKIRNHEEDIKNETIVNYKRKIDKKDLNHSISTQNCSTEFRRSKRFKEINSVTGDCNLNNTNLLKAIPFKDGIPEKLLRSRKEFRLPCHINLLRRLRQKQSPAKKKHKISKESTNWLPLTNNDVQNDSDVQCTKITIYSPTRTQFLPLKEENENGFRRPFDESSVIKQQLSVNYEPVTTMTMDLLGFHLNDSKNNAHLASSERISILPSISNLSSPQCTPPSSPPPNNLTPPMSPSSLDFFEPPKNDDVRQRKVRVKSGYEFEKLIKHKIKKIYEELDLQTDEDQKVAKWHEEIKPRLIEAERKPSFRIHEYEYRIIRKLETCDRKLQFDDIVRQEPPCEVARYFSATLQLASTNNLDINACEDLDKSIELVLLD